MKWTTQCGAVTASPHTCVMQHDNLRGSAVWVMTVQVAVAQVGG